MYVCDTLMKLLYPYLDGELDIKESLRVQTHLQECPYCLEIFKQEKEFLQALKSSISIQRAPEHLQGEISAALSASSWGPVREGNRKGFGSIFPSKFFRAATIAMLVIGLTGLMLYALPKQVQKQNIELVVTAVENHAGIVKGKIPFDIRSSEPDVILKWLQQGLDFPVQIPQDEFSTLRLVGGRLVHLQHKKAAFLTFESKEGMVSLLMTSPQTLQAIEGKVIPFKNLEFYLTHYKGYYALTWTDPQLSYVLVSDQKHRISEACGICHGETHSQDIAGFDQQI